MSEDVVYSIKTGVEPKLRKGIVTSKVLLGRSRFIEDASTKSSSFNDPSYLPFYYHLGTLFPAKSLVQVGVSLGLHAACFAQGVGTLDHFLGLQQEDPGQFYSPRLALGNVRDHMPRGSSAHIHTGLATDPPFLERLDAVAWDVAVVSEESTHEMHRSYLELLWDRMGQDDGGIICVEFLDRHPPSRRAFEDFCRVKNRDPVVIRTRYGVGIVQR